MALQLRCFITWPREATSYILGYVEHLSRFSVRVRCADESSAASCLLEKGDLVQIYIELPAQRVSGLRRSLYCVATVTDTSRSADGERMIAASVEDMQFRDLPERFPRQEVKSAAAVSPSRIM